MEPIPIPMQVDAGTKVLVEGHDFFLSEYLRYTNNNLQTFQRAERLNILWVVCNDLPRADNGIFAKLQLDTTLNIVENNFCNLPWNPAEPSDRLYPAGEDFRRNSGSDDVATYRNRAHYSHFAVNGAILIEKQLGANAIVFSKSGADGRNVGDFNASQLSRFS